MIDLMVNNRRVKGEPGEMLLSTLKRAGVHVPTLCHLEGLFPSGACRMCVVEVEGVSGLVPSCAYPVREGLTVFTHSTRAVQARKTIIELLLANHPDDCLYCNRNTHCDLQKLAADYNVRSRQYFGQRTSHNIDMSSPSIVRDPDKCILCGKCVRVCEEVQGVACIDFVGRGSKTTVGTAFEQGLNVSSCVNCGQCIMVCPTGALREHSHIKDVLAALDDPEKKVVVQHAPAISVTVGEELGLKPGTDAFGVLTAALRGMGFDRVFDTGFSADLTVIEEASELVHRIRNGGRLPMITSCSPGWVKFTEEFYPEFMGNISTCKSPQQMMGAIVKSYFAQQEGTEPANIYSVSIMPCVAKKFEASRPEMGSHGTPDVDAVLTTRELVQLLAMRGVDASKLRPERADTPFGDRSTAGKLFGATGGVMEAALRTAHFILTGEEWPKSRIQSLRGMAPRKEAQVKIGGTELGVVVVSGLMEARTLLEEIRQGRDDIHFIEVMTCPGGCIAGGGQPQHSDPEILKARMQALYAIDRDGDVRTAHSNRSVQRLYDEFLGEPLSPESHRLLHTHYVKRNVVL